MLKEPNRPAIRDRVVTVEVDVIEAELQEGLQDLADAKAMVETDPEIMGGAPCFAGSRIPVHDIADMVTNGDTIAAIAKAYPSLDGRRIYLATVYAAAYPRRGRPRRTPDRRRSRPIRSKRLGLDDLPPVA